MRALLLFLLVAACECSARPPPRTTSAPEPAPSEPAEPTPPPTPPPTPTVTPVELTPAQREAAAAVDADGTHCRRAYEAMVAMMQAIEKQQGGGEPLRVVDRLRFMAVCAELPAPVQQCMLTSYSREHREECQAANAALDEESRRRLQSILRAQ